MLSTNFSQKAGFIDSDCIEAYSTSRERCLWSKVSKKAQFSVVVLKRWLECHVMKKSGNKCELIEKVNQCICLIKVDPKEDEGIWCDQKKRCEALQCSSNGIACLSSPVLKPVGGWKNFEDWYHSKHIQLLTYLLLSCWIGWNYLPTNLVIGIRGKSGTKI